jgi:cytochrome d ubiquinol oxidase subunit I
MVDFTALLTNPYGLLKFFHTIFSGYVVAAFFVMGISAWHLLRKANQDFFRRSFRMAATFGLISALLVFLVGDFHAANVAGTQPAKFAAMEAVWETQKSAPYHFMLIPDVENERNTAEALSVPKLLSFLAFHNGNTEVRGLKEFPRADRPPVLPVLAGFGAWPASASFSCS